jgi:hypothetical protein
MKEAELRTHSQCFVCDKKIGQLPIPIFNIIEIERFVLKIDAVKRQQGLAMQLGGNGILASVMGPDEDMAQSMAKNKVMVCDDCILSRMPELIDAVLQESN